MKRWIWLVVGLSWLAAACVPVQVKDSCRRQMNECLKNCQKQYHHKPVGMQPQDRRSPCEEACHNLCWRKTPSKVTSQDKEAMRKLNPNR